MSKKKSNNFLGSNLDSSDVEDDIKIPNKTKKDKDLVLEKLQNSPKFSNSLSADELEALALILSTPSKLKKTYLSTKWTKNIKLIDDEIQEKKSSKKKNFSFLESNRKEKPDIILEESDGISFGNDISMQPNLTEKSISIKLLITEIANDSTRKLGREIISPILTTFNLARKFGLFHTGLLIGPWILVRILKI